MKILYSIIICIFVLQQAYSQSNYQPATVIDSKSDTLLGWVDYRDWDINPKEISFKKTLEEDAIILTPTDISAFSVQGETYKSALVEIETSSRNTQTLSSSPSIQTITAQVFLQELFNRQKKLFHLKNQDRANFFYIVQNDSTYKLLIYKKYLSKQNSRQLTRNVIAENKKYQGQLRFYFQDLPSIHKRVNQTEYTRKSMEELFQEYYLKSHPEAVQANKPQKNTTDLYIVAGAGLSSLALEGEMFRELPQNLNTVSYFAGVSLDISLPRNLAKWSINNELTLNNYNYKGNYKDYTNEDRYIITDSEIDYTYLRIANMVRYRFGIKNNRFFYINVGVSNGFAVIAKNTSLTNNRYYSTNTIEEGKAIAETRRLEQGYLIGLGTKFGKYLIETRFEQGNGMSAYSFGKSTTTHGSLLLGYQF
ncbi:outer membrane beta-barrel protein [Limibacter armeniacum]|uniref:outer membrane beta-barrel protein n=1 Tax=Limibacter armeniacum TaxID=466084 RepID=UPI002FE55881